MALDGVRDLTAIDVLADTGLIFLQQPGFKLSIPASGEQTPVVSRVMRKFVLALVEICRMGAGYRPLVTFQQAGRKGSRG